MHRNRRVLLVAVIGLALAAAPAGAITYGQPDSDNDFPFVALVITPAVGGGYYVCSGALISSDVVLTAAHCSDNLDAAGNPALYLVAFEKEAPFTWIPGHAVPHPDWPGYLSPPNTNDVGLIFLDIPQSITPAQVAPLGFADDLLIQRGTNDLRFVAVGYGLQESWPAQSNKPQEEWDIARWWGEQRLLQTSSAYTDGFNLMMTNNPGKGNGSGGTCSGDSGGPIIHKETGYIVAVNSFGVAPYCKGNDYVYRVDIENSQDFIFGP